MDATPRQAVRSGALARLCIAGRSLALLFPSPPVAVAAIAAWIMELGLLSWQGGGFFDNAGLTRGTQAGLAGLMFLYWIVMSWCLYWCFLLLDGIGRKLASGRAHRGLLLLGTALFAVIVNLHIASWFFYLRLGVFPDISALHFGMMNVGMLVKYFWQAERTAWIGGLIFFGVANAACLIGLLRIVRSHVRYNNRHANLFFRQGAVLLLTANASIVVMHAAQLAGDPHKSPKDRIEAGLAPWAPYSFELRYRVNPGIALLTSVALSEASELHGDIPADALRPIGSIKPKNFGDIEPENRLNVILITIESLRSDVILHEGQGHQVMPHVAELARSGRFFPRLYANASHSDYSDPCILSSLYPLRRQGLYYYRREDPWPKVLIYDLLKQYGYATAFISSQNEAWSNMHLFYESENLDLLYDSRSYKGSTLTVEQGSFGRWRDKTGQIAGKLDDAITVDHSIEWIEQQRIEDTPFCLLMNLQSSHFPYHRPDGIDGPFQPTQTSSQISLLSYSKEDAEPLRNSYYNALNYVDLQVGRLLEYLHEAGLREKTIIAITGDHGEAFLENGISGHAGPPLETVLKVGLVINSPGRIEPAVEDYYGQAVDIVPTIVAQLGLPPHPAHQGIDLLSSERPRLEERLVFVHCCRPGLHTSAVVSGTGWKLILDHRTESRELSYQATDLEPHPNLIESEIQVAAVLEDIMSEWRRRQLLYYNQPRYFGWFYPPSAPVISASDLRVLQTGSVR